MDYEILQNEVTAIVNYANSSRTIRFSKFIEEEKDTFYKKLLYHITGCAHNWFNDVTYQYVRLKLALSTRDFSCLELISYICYRFFNNPNVTERSKSQIKLINCDGHKFLYLAGEDKIISPVQKFSKLGSDFIFSYVKDYSNHVYHDSCVLMADFSFYLRAFKDIALIDPNIELRPYYRLEDLQSFETLPHELKEVVRPLREHGYI